MTRTMSKPLMPCSDHCVVRSLALILCLGPAAYASSGPIETDFSDQEILIKLPPQAEEPDPALATASDVADRIQAHLMRARTSGDPRSLGYAARLLKQWPEEKLTDRLQLLRATLHQSLHRFDQARTDLEQVIAGGSDVTVTVQARLTLANLELVQGHYASARSHCEQLSRQFPGLIAKSCLAQADARTGGADRAYQDLLQSVLSDLPADKQSVIWARTTLGELAAQLGLPAARHHLQAVLSVAPDDLYTRIQLADWHLQQGELERVLALTQQYEQVDALAVIRAIALKCAGDPDAGELAARLRERFAEARWRGTLLHQRDMARFQLDFEKDPQAALDHARANWQTQREPLDTRLLLRAARQAGNPQLFAEVSDWLAENNQVDARYPEPQP